MDPITIATIVLVLITGYYAYQTNRTVKEISLQRKDSSLPMIMAEEFDVRFNEERDYSCVEVVLENVGKGPAFNVDVSFFNRDTGKEDLSSDHLLPFVDQGNKKKHHIHIPNEQFENLRFKEEEKNGDLIADLVCYIYFQDIYKRTIMTNQSFVYNKNTKRIKPVLGEFSFLVED